MTIYEKLATIQAKLKAPKGQYNDFGKYKYRSCEDILETVKPLLAEVKAIVLLSDKMHFIGERYYVEATATFVDIEKPEDVIINTAFAREEETKKGMDGSQITGASSSYARKYALNGLFAIDDAKDSDSTNTGENEKKAVYQPTAEQEKALKEFNRTIAHVARSAKVTTENVTYEMVDNYIAQCYAFKAENEKKIKEMGEQK